jgi:hypothetical protein
MTPSGDTATDLKGYTTEVVMAKPIVARPCAEHDVPGWEDRARRATVHGWPVDGYTGGPHHPDCPACQAAGLIELDEVVVGWTSTDPRVVGVNERGEPIDHRGLDPNAPDPEA